MKTRVQFRMRVYRDERIAIGPGKIALLEAIAQAGSISAAARQIGMSYRRAWVLVDEVNRAFKGPAVHAAKGGAHGGGAALTGLGQTLVRRYRAAEDAANIAAAGDIDALMRMLAP